MSMLIVICFDSLCESLPKPLQCFFDASLNEALKTGPVTVTKCAPITQSLVM